MTLKMLSIISATHVLNTVNMQSAFRSSLLSLTTNQSDSSRLFLNLIIYKVTLGVRSAENLGGIEDINNHFQLGSEVERQWLP